MEPIEERVATLEKQLAEISARGKTLQLDEPQCDMLRKVMDAHIIRCLCEDNEIEALMAHCVYVDLWGYLSWESFREIATLRMRR